MYSAGVLFLVIQAWTLAGTVSYQAHDEPATEISDFKSKLIETLKNDNSRRENREATSYLFAATSQVERFISERTADSEKYWDQNEDTVNKIQTRKVQSDSSGSSTARKENTRTISKRSVPNSQRFKRATNKFTGLVVGAARDNTLKESVTKLLTVAESLVWSFQSQYSKPFIATKPGPAVLLGTFNSDFRTNFHGYDSEVHLRRSNDYSISDLNSLTTLLILQCLVEASLYGSANIPAVSNMSIALESLKAFYTHTYPRGSSILTMWPEKLLTGGKGWVNIPENIIGAKVMDNTTFNQLQHLAKSCNCEPAKSGLQKISENTLCKEHFARPLSDLFKDSATPPDFLTSFSNLALGSLLLTKFPAKHNGVYKAESELWLSANSDLQILINKLKSMVIIFPANRLEVSTNRSVNESSKNITSDLETQIHATSEIEVNITSGLNSTSTASSTGEQKDDVKGHNRTARSLPVPSNDVKVNESSESENVATEVNEDAASLNISTIPAVSNDSKITNVTPSPTTTIATTTVLLATPAATTKITSSTAPSATTEAGITDEPSSEPSHVNQVISSESYFAIRKYLDAVLTEEQQEDVILIPSLITDDESVVNNGGAVPKSDGNIWHNGQIFHAYNNVNLMTTATTLHAIVVSAMSGLIHLQNDTLLQKIVVSSLRLLTWYMDNPQEVVTMVTLSEFPSRYQLYWITARIAFQLNSKQAHKSGIFQFADNITASFVKALRDKMTFSILQSITDDGLGQDGKTRVYIDDFIGVEDLDDKGKKRVSGDDRVFTSAMGISALISTWTEQQDNGILEFVKDIGDPVRIAINSLANFISGVLTDHPISNLNAFMSEQIKNCETMPARYPSNVITSSDGKELNPTEPRIDTRFGVQGYISKGEYQKLLDMPRFGYKTRGGSLEDLNSQTSVFRFWSSPAYTKAAALLAIAQAANLVVDNNS